MHYNFLVIVTVTCFPVIVTVTSSYSGTVHRAVARVSRRSRVLTLDDRRTRQCRHSLSLSCQQTSASFWAALDCTRLSHCHCVRRRTGHWCPGRGPGGGAVGRTVPGPAGPGGHGRPGRRPGSLQVSSMCIESVLAVGDCGLCQTLAA